MYIQTHNNKKSGMTLFIAIVVMGILLLISFAVVNIAIKSTQFAQIGKDSQMAFYAAETGLECALYWDQKYVNEFMGIFPVYGEAFSTSTTPADRAIYCSGSGVQGVGQALYGTTTIGRIGTGGNSNPTSVFSFLMTPGEVSGPCAVVTVNKRYQGSVYVTDIKSRGYNSCDTNNPRRVERGVEVTY